MSMKKSSSALTTSSASGQLVEIQRCPRIALYDRFLIRDFDDDLFFPLCFVSWLPVAVDEAALKDISKKRAFSFYWSHHILVLWHSCVITTFAPAIVIFWVTIVLHFITFHKISPSFITYSQNLPIANKSLVGFWGGKLAPHVSRIRSRLLRWPTAVWTKTTIDAWVLCWAVATADAD